MDKIYLIGGQTESSSVADHCMEFDIRSCEWRERRGLTERRREAACAVFEGRVVVSGGERYHDGDAVGEDEKRNFYFDCFDEVVKVLKTVEQYDPFSDAWSGFPSMINARCRHKSVAMKNKLFVIGGGTEKCEVYDSDCKAFVAIRPLSEFILFGNKRWLAGDVFSEFFFFPNDPAAAFAVGNEIFVFRQNSPTVLCYDVESDQWREKSCGTLEVLQDYSCVKVPRL